MSVMLSGSIFQSTLPGWGATGDGNQPTVATAISIHAPRVGSDAGHPVPARLDGRISIHAPRMGSDNEQEVAKTEAETFQSTLPGWGATRIGGFDGSVFKFQSTLPGWGATIDTRNGVLIVSISIHAPRMGSDPGIGVSCIRKSSYFNPRSPDGERRRLRFETPQIKAISIHAPRMGSDSTVSSSLDSLKKFQSTLPGWGATNLIALWSPGLSDFNPRSPDGERRSI